MINKPNGQTENLPYKDMCKAKRYLVPDHKGDVPGEVANKMFVNMKPSKKSKGY